MIQTCFRFKIKQMGEIVEIIPPNVFTDYRGSLTRLYDKKVFENFETLLPQSWVQESIFYTAKKNTLRGIHVSLPPYQESKMIIAIKGITSWITVDVRKKSSMLGQWNATILSATTHNILCVGAGFAHGCISLTDDCELLIKTNQFFSEKHSTGIIWNDETLKIDWGLSDAEPIISEQHKNYQSFETFLKNHGGGL